VNYVWSYFHHQISASTRGASDDGETTDHGFRFAKIAFVKLLRDQEVKICLLQLLPVRRHIGEIQLRAIEASDLKFIAIFAQ